jgi:hypothetical protein
MKDVLSVISIFSHFWVTVNELLKETEDGVGYKL